MSGVPSFSSFPELPQLQRKAEGEAKQDTKTASAPVFSSFPELPAATAGPSRHLADAGRRDERTTKHQDEGHRSRIHGSRDRERDRKRSRSPRRHDDRDRRRHRDREDEEVRRKQKEERRRKEREAAERLIRGEAVGVASDRREDRPSQTTSWTREDGGAWYESVTGPRRKGYEEPFDPTSSNSWFRDSVGDKEAIRYSTAASHSAPRYRRDGNGKIIGLNDGIRIVFTKEKSEQGVELAPKGRPYIPRYSARTLEGSASRHLGRFLLHPDRGAKFDSNASYVAVRQPRARPAETDDTPDYRAITKPVLDDEEDVEAMGNTLDGYDTLEQSLRRQTAEMERSLREHPENVDLWIRYSTLHLKSSPNLTKTSANAFVDPLTLPQNRASAEVTLSILSRGLDAHPTNFYSPALHIAYIRTAEKFWQPEEVTSRWKNVLRDLGQKVGQPGSEGLEEGMISIWLGYIEWREGQGFGKSEGKVIGGVDEVIEVYAECLSGISAGKIGGSSQMKEENQLYLFLRACVFIKQAGYAERALASFQAMMEITFFKPDRLRPSPTSGQEWFEGLLSDFEEFWDEEAPRFGESKSRGWRDARSEDTPSKDVPEIEHTSSDPFEKWLEAERHAEKALSRPGRAKNLDDEDDPFRVVLFSDIKALLFPIRSPQVRLQLVYALLTFIGLPFSPPEVPSSSPTASDPHLRSSLAYNDTARAAFWPPRAGTRRIPWQTVGGEPMTPENPTSLEHPFGCPVKCWTSERNTLFAQSTKWSRDLDAADMSHVDIDFARQSFNLLRPLIPDPSFTLAYFAFEAAVSPKAAVKASKAILAEDRDNLVLWDGYARLERQRGNVAAARVVYATALQAALAKEDVDEEDKLEIWASWAEMEFEQDEARCMEVIIMAMGFETGRLGHASDPDHAATAPSTITMLKARQRLKTIEPPFGSSQLTLLALFTYLADGVDSCRDMIMRQLAKVPESSSYAEEAHQLLVKILYIHCARRASPAALSRDALELAINSFPHNTMFLSLYLFGELGSRVYGRVQKLIYNISITDKAGVIGHLWAVWAEAMTSHRTFWDKGGGGAERVRNALDRGINSSSGKYSVPLWKLYIEFETLMGRYSAAKQLCYRAVSAIGGCKELYLLPFSPELRLHFTTYDLKTWAEMMIERGIRLRIPFEAYFDTTRDEEQTLALPEDEELQDDELRFLGEREELKPY